MKALVEIQFEIDGEFPGEEPVLDALWRLVASSSYVGSEGVDGTDGWGLEVGETSISIIEK